MPVNAPVMAQSPYDAELVNVNGRLCVRTVDYLWTKPAKVLADYATGLSFLDWAWGSFEPEALPIPLRRVSSGVYADARRDIPVRREFRIDPHVPPIGAEEVAVPCPKVRFGLETRWHEGRWQKYLKTQGWVPA